MLTRRIILQVALVAGLMTGAFSVLAAESGVTPDEVIRGELLGATGDSTTSIQASEVLALSDEMRQFLRQNVNFGGTDIFKLQQLIDALMGTSRFKLEYDENTRTASETFRLRKGNCLSFTTLFVALARGADLDADFQEVDIPPDWSTRSDVFVLNRHINVIVEMGMSGTQAVDFNIGDFKTTYKVEPISDSRAVAHFFNNMGVERMQAGDYVDAVAFFRQAIHSSDREFSPAWTNLGLLYRREGYIEHAETAYLQAIKVDRGDYVAMSNLVSLYEEQGEGEKAEVYRKKVDQHRLRNPHLRFDLARDAFEAGDFDTAIDHLKSAVRKTKDEPEYYFLLGSCYLMKGDGEKARKWLDKSLKVAETDDLKRRYSARIEALMAAAGN